MLDQVLAKEMGPAGAKTEETSSWNGRQDTGNCQAMFQKAEDIAKEKSRRNSHPP